MELNFDMGLTKAISTAIFGANSAAEKQRTDGTVLALVEKN